MENEQLSQAEEAALKGEPAPVENPDPTPEPQPAVQAEPTGEQKPAEKPKTEADETPKVPIHALHEARQQVKALREELAALRAQQQKPATSEPDVDQDPVAVLKLTRQELRQEREQRERAAQEQAQNQQFVSAYRNAAQIYAQQNPEFQDAYTHLVKSRYDELVAVGYSPEEANAAIHNEERAIVLKAFQDGVNPGERLFNLSRVRGYKKASPEPKPNATAEERLSTIEKGQQAGKSLTAAGGAAEPPLSLKSLVDMSDEEFDSLPPEKLRKALGG